MTAHLGDRGLAMKWKTSPGKPWHWGMAGPIGVDQESGLIHSVGTTATKVGSIIPAAAPLHGEQEVVSAKAGSVEGVR